MKIYTRFPTSRMGEVLLHGLRSVISKNRVEADDYFNEIERLLTHINDNKAFIALAIKTGGIAGLNGVDAVRSSKYYTLATQRMYAMMAANGEQYLDAFFDYYCSSFAHYSDNAMSSRCYLYYLKWLAEYMRDDVRVAALADKLTAVFSNRSSLGKPVYGKLAERFKNKPVSDCTIVYPTTQYGA